MNIQLTICRNRKTDKLSLRRSDGHSVEYMCIDGDFADEKDADKIGVFEWEERRQRTPEAAEVSDQQSVAKLKRDLSNGPCKQCGAKWDSDKCLFPNDCHAPQAMVRAPEALRAHPHKPEPTEPTEKSKLPGSFDAMDWVREWMQTIKQNPSIPTDEGTMLAWFANAIMAGWDEHKRRYPVAPPTPPAEWMAVEHIKTLLIKMAEGWEHQADAWAAEGDPREYDWNECATEIRLFVQDVIEAKHYSAPAEGWIKCSDRLPEIGEEVQVYCIESVYPEKPRVKALARFIPYEEATTYYWDIAYGGGNRHTQQAVIAWQPLAAAPKEGK